MMDFIAAHKEAFVLLGLAAVAAMPPALPASLWSREPLDWAYTWLHDALKTFINLRRPSAAPKEITK